MQTTVYIPATRKRTIPTWPNGVGTAAVYESRPTPCAIIAFVGIAGIESAHHNAGAFTTVHAVAMWDDGQLFEADISEFSVQPEVDLTPPPDPDFAEISKETLERVKAAQAANERLRRQHR